MNILRRLYCHPLLFLLLVLLLVHTIICVRITGVVVYVAIATVVLCIACAIVCGRGGRRRLTPVLVGIVVVHLAQWLSVVICVFSALGSLVIKYNIRLIQCVSLLLSLRERTSTFHVPIYLYWQLISILVGALCNVHWPSWTR